MRRNTTHPSTHMCPDTRSRSVHEVDAAHVPYALPSAPPTMYQSYIYDVMCPHTTRLYVFCVLLLLYTSANLNTLLVLSKALLRLYYGSAKARLRLYQ